MRARQKFCLYLDWNLLKMFHAIVGANGVSSAANTIGRTQSTVSLALQRLEKHLGQTLCRRGAAGFELTDEGRILYDFVSDLYGRLEQIPDTLDDAVPELRGRLRLRIISNFVSAKFDKLLVAYNVRCPRVEIQIEIATWETIQTAVLRNEVDVGIAPVRERIPDLRYDFLTREAHLVYCGKKHPLFGAAVSALETLANEPLILTGADEPETLTYFRMRHGLGKRIAASTPNLEEARRLTVLGLGVCLLPEGFAAEGVGKGDLWPLTPQSLGTGCDIYAITSRHAPQRLISEVFMNELRAEGDAILAPTSVGPMQAAEREC